MKTVTITLQIPDGVDVQVRQSQGSAPSQRQAPTAEGACPVHGVPWIIIPAGYSKTKVDDNGNPKHYAAFAACPERGCNEKPNQQPQNQGVSDITNDDPFSDIGF